MATELTLAATVLTRLIPSADRDAIVGDLMEEICWRGLRGRHVTWWMALQCVTIALGLAADHVRGAVTLGVAREVAGGVAVEGVHALRSGWTAPRALVTRVALFAVSVAVLAMSVEVLVAALLSAAGLR